MIESIHKSNTVLAQKLAGIYEQYLGGFPGGITNARIQRTRAGHWLRSAGAWSWFLRIIDNQYGHPIDFGSQYPAKECVTAHYKICYGFEVDQRLVEPPE